MAIARRSGRGKNSKAVQKKRRKRLNGFPPLARLEAAVMKKEKWLREEQERISQSGPVRILVKGGVKQ